METMQWTTIDRAAVKWPSGPWDGEPDKMQWPDADTGLPCLAVRHGSSGHWCGYVGVNEGHPAHGKDYGKVDVDVHYGLTFADRCGPGETEATGICHTPGPGEPDHVWWLGFDCHHLGDYSPGDLRMADEYPSFSNLRGGRYWTLPEVRNECRRLAAQLAEQPEGLKAAAGANGPDAVGGST